MFLIDIKILDASLRLRDPANPYRYLGSLSFRSAFFNMDSLHAPQGVDKHLAGATLQNSRMVDNFFSKDVRKSLLTC
jgi:hypothetical protein